MIALLKGGGDLNQQFQVQLRWIARYYVVVAQGAKQKPGRIHDGDATVCEYGFAGRMVGQP